MTPPDIPAYAIRVGDWVADRSLGRLSRADQVRMVEPKVMDLLFLLASRPNGVFSREDLLRDLWPGVTVGEDALSRCVWKLRRALSDDPRAPRFVETISKRGYRLIAPTRTLDPARAISAEKGAPAWSRQDVFAAAAVVACVLLTGLAFAVGAGAWRGAAGPAPSEAALLTERADDFYFQFRRQDNEAAMELYGRAIASRPDYAPALAGLANALVQRVVRWPNPVTVPDPPRTDLAGAIAQGRTTTPEARRRLGRALFLAQGAVRLAPGDARTQKALGLAYAAQSRFDLADKAYEHAVALDPNAWEAMVDLGEIAGLRGDSRGAIGRFEQAYAAMTRVYEVQAPRVRPWYPEFGVLIGDRYAALGAFGPAETWYRRVLSQTPFHEGATRGLAAMLARSGDRAGARDLCQRLADRTGPSPSCVAALETSAKPRSAMQVARQDAAR